MLSFTSRRRWGCGSSLRVHTITTNLAGTEVVLQAAAKKRRKVLLASTSEVYGKRTAVPFREDDDLVLGPPSKHRWSYACSKAADEFLALAYWGEHQLPVVIVRLFNTVGPGQSGLYGMVVPRFVEQALTGAPITVYGDGQQSRCFAYVGDVVRLLTSLAECPEAVGEIFNVGNDEEITILALARRIKELTRSPSEIVLVPYEVAYARSLEDMPRRVPDVGKLLRLLSDRPRTKLEDILAAVIAHARQRPLAPSAPPAHASQPSANIRGG